MVAPEVEARWRSYLVDGSDTVLKNSFGYTNRFDLDDVEYAITAIRAWEIKSGVAPIEQTFDADHLKAIHAHLGGDLYEWAGTFRDVPLVKGGSSFVKPDALEEHVAALHDRIVEIPWSTLESYEVTEHLGRLYGSVNAIHPFREINGRSARLFMADIAGHAGYHFAEEAVQRGELVEAAKQSYFGHYEEAQAMFARHTTPLSAADLPRAPSYRTPASREKVRELFHVDVDHGESLSERLGHLTARRDPLLAAVDVTPALQRSGMQLH